MTSRVLGLAAVAAAVTAAGVGGYLAARTSSEPATSTEAQAQLPAAPAQPPAPGVAETEGVIPAAAPAPAPAAAPVERETRDTPARDRRAVSPAPNPVPSPRTPPKPVTQNRPIPAKPEAPPPTPAPRSEAPGAAATIEPARDTPAQEPPPLDTRPAEDRPAVVEAPPAPRLEEFTVPADSVIGLQLDGTVSSETARVEQRVDAHVTRDVRVGGTVVVPAGTKAVGQVTLVEPGGKFRERARLGVRFHTLVLADGTSVPIQTEAIYREGDAVGKRSAARIGGSAIGGALIGAIFGGGKGAAIGAAAGAGAGTAATMATDKSQVTLHSGSTVTVRLTGPTTVTVEHDND